MLRIFANWGMPKPFKQGWMRVSEIHKIFYQEVGNPKGMPVICFHGGPGYRSNIWTAKKFDLRKYRVILFDQRGCGKSTPQGEVRDNTTQDLVDDAAKLLNHLGITTKVMVFGSSWGTTLALLFGEKYPQKVQRMLLSKVFLADKNSRDWEQKYSAWFYPDIMDEIRMVVPDREKTAAFFDKEISSDDLQKQVRAVRLYGRYERVLGSLEPKLGDESVTEEEVNACRVMMHYAANGFFMAENEILDNINRLQGIPAAIFHNRLDMVCPVIGAYSLAKAWKGVELAVLPSEGHGSKMLDDAVVRYIQNLY